MPSDVEPLNRRVPTLVQCCQRVASNHVDSIYSLGDELSYELVEPILRSCNASSLLRLEQASPHLRGDTPEIWRSLCFKTYPLATEHFLLGEIEEPSSWKDQYYVLEASELQRLEEVGSRLRSQRLEAEERKKESSVKLTKLTDRLPPMKRSRGGWGAPTPPKTLFQKTRSEASKIQRNVFFAPPMPPSRNFRVLPNTSSAQLSLAPSQVPNRVTVKTVVYHRSPSGNSPSTSNVPLASSLSGRSNATSSATPNISSVLVTPASHSAASASADKYISSSTEISPIFPPLSDTRPPKSSNIPKKDPMATLFIPKHRAHSQRPHPGTATQRST